MAAEKYPISFFEIPVVDFERARKFYETVTGSSLDVNDMGEAKIGFFPRGEFVGGAIVLSENYTPSQQGTVVYLNAGGDLDGLLARVEASGGKIVRPKTSIGEFGWVAHFADTEGNLVAAHSM